MNGTVAGDSSSHVNVSEMLVNIVRVLAALKCVREVRECVGRTGFTISKPSVR